MLATTLPPDSTRDQANGAAGVAVNICSSDIEKLPDRRLSKLKPGNSASHGQHLFL